MKRINIIIGLFVLFSTACGSTSTPLPNQVDDIIREFDPNKSEGYISTKSPTISLTPSPTQTSINTGGEIEEPDTIAEKKLPGRLSFLCESTLSIEICASDPDGSNFVYLTTDGIDDTWFSWSLDGKKILYTKYIRENEVDIFLMDADGSNQINLTNQPAIYGNPIISPNGHKVAFTYRDEKWSDDDIFIIDVDVSNKKNLTNSPDIAESQLHWSQDGNIIAYVGRTDNFNDIYVIDINGTASRKITDGTNSISFAKWSPDMSQLVIKTLNGSGENQEVFLTDINGENKISLSEHKIFSVFGLPVIWSPDGKQIAFIILNDFGKSSISIMNSDGSNIQNLTSQLEFVGSPAWSPDGNTIAFLSQSDEKVNIYLINPDGTNLAKFPNDEIVILGELKWTP
jgi:TolB protein